MALTINKLICTTIDSIMLFIAQIYKAVIAAASIGMDDAVRIHTAHIMACSVASVQTGTISAYMLPSRLKIPKTGVFLYAPRLPFTSEVTLINLNFTLDGGLFFAEIGDSSSHQGQISITVFLFKPVNEAMVFASTSWTTYWNKSVNLASGTFARFTYLFFNVMTKIQTIIITPF
jgi:hypothetical protein